MVRAISNIRIAEKTDVRTANATVAAAQAAADVNWRGGDNTEVIQAISNAIGFVMHSVSDELEPDEDVDDDIEPYTLEDADHACNEAMEMISEINQREHDLEIGCLSKGKHRGRCAW